jgi:hypothetical protein
MLSFLLENLAVIIMTMLIAAALAGAIAKIIRDKKNGLACSSGCGGCALSGHCQSAKPKK